MGAPTVPAAEKGERYTDLAVQRLSELARAYHRQPVREYRHAEPPDATG